MAMTRQEALAARERAQTIIDAYEHLDRLRAQREAANQCVTTQGSVEVTIDAITVRVPMPSPLGQQIWRAAIDHIDVQIAKREGVMKTDS